MTLLGTLEQFGISEDLHRWISAFLIGRKQAVVVDGEKSEDEDVLSGISQGTVVCPLLFLLHIIDLPHVLYPETRCRLFADDCLLNRTEAPTRPQESGTMGIHLGHAL